MSVCLAVCLSGCLSVCLLACLPLCMYICTYARTHVLRIYVYACICMYMHRYMSMYLYICASIGIGNGLGISPSRNHLRKKTHLADRLDPSVKLKIKFDLINLFFLPSADGSRRSPMRARKVPAPPDGQRCPRAKSTPGRSGVPPSTCSAPLAGGWRPRPAEASTRRPPRPSRWGFAANVGRPSLPVRRPARRTQKK